MTLPYPQEPNGERKGHAAANGYPPLPRAAKAPAAEPSERSADEREGLHARGACEWVGLACYLNTVSEITLCHWTKENAMTNNEPVQMITRIPADLRDRIKAHAALERMSVNELVARVMDAAVLRDLESVRQAAAIK
jgi:hypothetical protein